MRKLPTEFYDKKGNLRSKYYHALMTRNGFKFYTESQTGSGRWTRYVSQKFALLDIFRALDIKYENRNDAPRGGRYGDYFLVNKIMLNRILKIKNTI
jgi:hypothetical protein